jgi:hypothetical protein
LSPKKKNSWFDQMTKNKHVEGPAITAARKAVLRQQLNGTDRDPRVFHPSEVARFDWCVRHDVYRMLGPAGIEGIEPAPVPLERMSVFEHGHMVHEKWQRWLSDVLVGNWKCPQGHVFWATGRPDGCPECGLPLKYAEVPVVDPHLGIGGHADGLIGKTLLEIKSVGPGTWWALDSETARRASETTTVDWDKVWWQFSAPFGEHILQASIYAAILQDQGLCDGTITFIYERKENQQFKEFTIDLDVSLVADLFGAMSAARADVEEGSVPDRPPWAFEGHTVCKACPFTIQCWEG